jgi:hypothetical protein
MLNTDPNHIHTYNAQGKQLCCSEEEKIYAKADAKQLLHNGQNNGGKEQKPLVKIDDTVPACNHKFYNVAYWHCVR